MVVYQLFTKSGIFLNNLLSNHIDLVTVNKRRDMKWVGISSRNMEKKHEKSHRVRILENAGK